MSDLDAWDDETDDNGDETAAQSDGLPDELAGRRANAREVVADAEAPPRYADVVEFVEQWLAPTWRRAGVNERVQIAREVRWCPEWWRHSEVVDRLEATWRAWEAARRDPNPAALASWWLGVLDPMMAVILDEETGPFTSCDSEHVMPAMLPTLAPPPGREDMA